MDRLRVEQTQWHLRSRQAAYRAKETKDEAVKKQHLAESAELQAEQFKLLIKAAAMKVRGRLLCAGLIVSMAISNGDTAVLS